MSNETWLEDANGNKCSVEYFGSREAAQAALDGLKDCKNCINCSDCSVAPETVTPKKPKVLIYGPPGVGKTWVSLEFPAVYYIDTEGGCRAGWVVHLAGEAGRELEAFHGTELAAILIYRESSPLRINPARFYEADAAALADIKRMAELEAAQP